ncbi:MAG: hypothetical protein K2W96_02600 [Gemmataceae bacterium]|nr:hypothetical protein [Gemmataceae bacterium]
MKALAALLGTLVLSQAIHAGPPTIPPSGTATPKYLSMVIHNSTRMTVNYSLRWGPHGSAVNYSLAPGGKRVHAIPTAGGFKRAMVTYDRDIRTGKVQRYSAEQSPTLVNNPNWGVVRRFQLVHNGTSLWLGW